MDISTETIPDNTRTEFVVICMIPIDLYDFKCPNVLNDYIDV